MLLAKKQSPKAVTALGLVTIWGLLLFAYYLLLFSIT